MRLALFILFLPVLSAALSAASFANESGNGLYGADSVFVINSFHFDITGRTQPFAVIRRLGLTLGEEIRGLSNLRAFTASREQALINERLFNTAVIRSEVGPPGPDGRFPVDLFFEIEDSWNILILPIPQYSSSSGFEFTLSGRDYNFMGAMSPLRADLGYQSETEGRSFFLFALEAAPPFAAWGLIWRVKFSNEIRYRMDSPAPFHFANTTGFSVEFPLGRSTLTAGFSESFIYNDENEQRDRPRFGDYQIGFYMSSRPSLSLEIPLGAEAGPFGELVYTVYTAGVFNHAFARWPLAENRAGPFLQFGHALGAGNVDWIGNFRRGFDFQAENSYSHDFHSMREGTNAFDIYAAASAQGHFIFGGRAGLSARLMFRHWSYRAFNFNDEAGDALRGVIDRSLTASSMLSLNLDFPVRVFAFHPSGGAGRMRFFGFEMHVAPILDFAIYRDPVNGVAFDITNTIIGYGLEMMFFPQAARSVYFRMSVASNFSRHISPQPAAGEIEIFLGLRHHF